MDTRRRPAAAPPPAATHPTFQLGCFAASIQGRISSPITCMKGLVTFADGLKCLCSFSRSEYEVPTWQYPSISSFVFTFILPSNESQQIIWMKGFEWIGLFCMTAPPLGGAGDFTISFVRPALDSRRQRQAHRGDLFYQPTPAPLSKAFQNRNSTS